MPQVKLGRSATYDDLVGVPENLVAEIVDGELWTSPRPAPRHATAQGSLGSLITPPFQFGHGGPGGWRILPEPELHLGPQTVVPDLAGWRLERMPRLPATAYFTLAPDWVCEVLSPSTAVLDRAKKLPIYAEAGVSHVWLIDPILRSLEALRRDGTHWTLLDTHVGQAIVRAGPVEAIALQLGLLWAEAEPTPAR